MLVSVIIPCYNVKQYITPCLISVINQTYKNIEIICVDDGSTDETAQEIQQFIENSPKSNIQLLRQENKGAPSARNRGIRHAKGGYFQFLDADDQLLPQKIENQIKEAIKNNYPQLIVGSYKSINEYGQLITQQKYPTINNQPWLDLLEAKLGNTCSNLFKAEPMKNGLLWNEQLKSSQEFDVMFKLLKDNATVIYTSNIETIILMRSSGSISSNNIKENRKRYINVRKKAIDFIDKNNINVNLNKCYQVLFDSIRSLYPFDEKLAIEYFDTYIPKGFTPQPSIATTKNYILTYRLLGFKKAEQLKKLIS